MPASFLIVLMIMVLAFVAPLIACVVLALAINGRARRLALKSMGWGAATGAAAPGVWCFLYYLVVPPEHRVAPIGSSLAIHFGAGFTPGASAALLWSIVARQRAVGMKGGRRQEPS